MLRGGLKEASRRPQGGLEEASVRPRGGKGARAGPAYEVPRTTKLSSEDLTRRWARGPANCKLVFKILDSLKGLLQMRGSTRHEAQRFGGL